MLFLVSLVNSDLNLFHLKVLLNPVLNCSKVFCHFQLIKSQPCWIISLSCSCSFCCNISQTQFSDQFKVKNTSQLIKGMSKRLQKLLKCFNGTTISSFFLVFVFSCSVFLPFLDFHSMFFCNTAFVFKRLRICYELCIIIGGRSIIRFISVIIPQTSCCFSIVFTVLKQINIGITTSKSSALSINTLGI